MKNIKKQDKDLILSKHKILINAKSKLKTEFVGLDSIIDEVIELIEPWYLFPDAQLRPSIINLFGMTGTGKTSLITRLFEILDMKSVMRFDTGEWVDKTEYQLSTTISGQIKKLQSDDSRPIFILDEFQLGRTIDDLGGEIDRPNLRVVWDLLDSGKFSIVEESWQSHTVQSIYNKLLFLINNKNLKAKYGKITKGRKEWEVYFDYSDKDLDKSDIKELKNYYTTNAIISPNDIYSLFDVSDNFLSERELAKYLLTLSNEHETLKFLEELLVNSSKAVEYDFSNSIIFIIGNLDNAYTMSNDMDADVDADFLYEHTKKITISDIKKSLSNLYRPEQVSRLGNNYLIYRSFNSKIYKDLIELELNKISDKIVKKFDINITFSDNTKDLIYKEGVFATQGVRPVFSTITSLIETKIGRVIIDILKNNLNPNNIFWETDKKKTNFILIIDEKKTFKYDIKLKVDNLRKSIGDDIQSLVGIHESGHILTSVYELNICPTLAVSKTLRDGGFTQINIPEWDTRSLLEKQLVMLLGGYVAEKLVFGEDNLTTGSFSDLEKTTSIVLSMIKDYGMNGTPLHYSTPDFRISKRALDDHELDKIAEDIIIKTMKKTEKLLTDNMFLLLKMGEYLTKKSKIEEKDIKKLVKKYGAYDIPIYKTKDNYYDYKNILKSKLNDTLKKN